MQFYAVCSESNLRIRLTDIILRFEAAYWLDNKHQAFRLGIEIGGYSKDKRGQA